MAKRKNYSATFKSKVALAALAGEKTLAELSSDYGIHQNLVSKWKKQLTDAAISVFAGDIKPEEAAREKEIKELHAKIGQLTMERDFLATAWEKR